jgi:hypothetical protein
LADETIPTGNDDEDGPRPDKGAPGHDQAIDAEAGADVAVPQGVAAEREAESSPEDESAGATGDSFAAAPDSPDPYEGAVPPGYDWPTHGGYLGCLLGLMVACIAGGFLGSLVVGLVSVSPLGRLVGTPAVRISLILAVFVATMLALGRVGWVLGKRFYREYPQPGSQPTGAPEVTSGRDAQDAETNREMTQRS